MNQPPLHPFNEKAIWHDICALRETHALHVMQFILEMKFNQEVKDKFEVNCSPQRPGPLWSISRQVFLPHPRPVWPSDSCFLNLSGNWPVRRVGCFYLCVLVQQYILCLWQDNVINIKIRPSSILLRKIELILQILFVIAWRQSVEEVRILSCTTDPNLVKCRWGNIPTDMPQLQARNPAFQITMALTTVSFP